MYEKSERFWSNIPPVGQGPKTSGQPLFPYGQLPLGQRDCRKYGQQLAQPDWFKLNNPSHPTSQLAPPGPSKEELSKIGIINLTSNFQICLAQAQILQKGLTFVPTPSQVPTKQFQEGTDRFIRSLKLKFCYLHFKKSDSGAPQKFRVPSSFTPPPGTYPPEIEELSIRLKQGIRSLNKNLKIRDNLTREDRKATKELSNNRAIVIKPADKGSAIVIMDRQDYVFEAERQLQVNRHYRQINEPQFPENCKIFNSILQTMLKHNLLSKREFSFLQASPSARERIFYLLPKIHKEQHKWTVPGKIPPGRPIVSDINSESCNIAKFIDFHLAPFSNTHPAYVKNTYDFLEKLGKITCPPHTVLISLDVDSLYTNIDNDLGIRAVSQAFATDPKPIHPYIIQLLRLSLEGNDFTFNGKHYLQISGTAMGKIFAPHYADIVLAYWEKENLVKCPLQPIFWKRYLDDVILLWDHPITDFDHFFQILNSAHPNIKLKSNIQHSQIEFLDVLIYKGAHFQEKGKLDTKVFFKETDSHSLLHKTSFHPKHTFSGLIKSQLIRFGRICQHEYDFDEASSILFEAIKPRGYSARFLRSIKSEIKIKFFPPSHQTGMTPCKFIRCSICPYVNTAKTIPTRLGDIRLAAGANCNTKLAVYILGCHRCPKLYYIGQSTNLRARLIAHFSDIRLQRPKEVAQHFSQQDHSPQDLWVSTLEVPTKAKNLDKIETAWIERLNTVNMGLNTQEGNQEGDILPFILQHHPSSSHIYNIAQRWWEGFQADNPSTTKKQPITIIRASAKNKNLSQVMVRSLLPPQNTSQINSE